MSKKNEEKVAGRFLAKDGGTELFRFDGTLTFVEGGEWFGEVIIKGPFPQLLVAKEIIKFLETDDGRVGAVNCESSISPSGSRTSLNIKFKGVGEIKG